MASTQLAWAQRTCKAAHQTMAALSPCKSCLHTAVHAQADLYHSTHSVHMLAALPDLHLLHGPMHPSAPCLAALAGRNRLAL